MKLRVGILVICMLFASFPTVAMDSSSPFEDVKGIQAVHGNSWRATTNQFKEFSFNKEFACQLANKDDLEVLNNLFKFPKVRNAFFTTGNNWNDTSIADYLLRNVESNSSRILFKFTWILRKGTEVCGYCEADHLCEGNVYNMPEDYTDYETSPHLNLALAIFPSYQGKGLGTALTKALSGHLFTHTNAEVLVYTCFQSNVASKTCAKKCNFTQKGVLEASQEDFFTLTRSRTEIE